MSINTKFTLAALKLGRLAEKLDEKEKKDLVEIIGEIESSITAMNDSNSALKQMANSLGNGIGEEVGHNLRF